MTTKTRAPLDAGLLNALGVTFFKQLRDGRWACFFLFGGKKGRILPSESTGRLFRWVSSASMLLGFVALFTGSVQAGLWVSTSHSTMNLPVILAAGFAAWAIPVLPSALWVRRRFRRLPKTDEALSPEEGCYQGRTTAWIGFAMAAVLFFEAGVSYAENHRELVAGGMLSLAGGIVFISISVLLLNHIIRAAHR